MYLRLQFLDELRSLLRKDVEQTPELAVLNALCGCAKYLVGSGATLDEVVEYRDHFIVGHMEPPSV